MRCALKSQCHMSPASQSKRPHTAVIAHVFYTELWEELKICINNIRECVLAGSVDVFITYPRIRTFVETIPGARVVSVENRGWDSWPFCKILNEIDLSSYDYVVKLHTKRDIPRFWLNFHVFRGGEWRTELLPFCSSQESTLRTFRALALQPHLGMVAAERVIDPIGGGTWRKCELGKQDDIVRSLGYEPRERTLVYGTMFAVRASLLTPIWRRYSGDDFSSPQKGNEHAEYGLAGDLELIYGLLVRAQGYFVSSAIRSEWLARLWYFCKGCYFRTLRFVSDAVRRSPFSRMFNTFLERCEK